MTLRQQLANEPAATTRRVTNITAALTALRDAIDMHDGFPTSTIGASDPEAGTVRLYEGNCRDIVTSEPNGLGITTRCNRPRPCPEHDTHVPLTSVERAAGNLGPLFAQHDQLVTAVNEWLRMGAHIDRLAAAHIPKPDNKGERCNGGTGREGVIVWGEPGCANIRAADRGGMCDACAKREYRWRKAHDLPARERDAA